MYFVWDCVYLSIVLVYLLFCIDGLITFTGFQTCSWGLDGILGGIKKYLSLIGFWDLRDNNKKKHESNM